MERPMWVITAHKRSLGQGNVFTPVYHSVQGARGWLTSAHHRSLDRGGFCIQGGLHPGILGGGVSACRAVCLWGYVHPEGVHRGGGQTLSHRILRDTGGTHPTGMYSCCIFVLFTVRE